jgi:dipeptidyl aminopeptidase/acylaminoacyl peptidase
MDNAQGFAHIAYFNDLKASKPSAWLTSGQWIVDSICGVDKEKSLVYYISTEVHSIQRHLYSVSLDGTKTKITPRQDVKINAIVPSLSHKIGDNIDELGYYSASFSPSCMYYTLSYLGPDIPFTNLYSTNDLAFKAEISQQNAGLYNEYAFPPKNYISIPNDNGDGNFKLKVLEMNCEIIVPADFDSSGVTKYPVLMHG